jgi:hypothetical protein
MTKLRETGWAGHLPQMICMRNKYKIPVIKLDGKLTGRPRQRCESNFIRKTDLKTLSGFMRWINFSQNKSQQLAFLNMIVNIYIDCRWKIL